MNLLVDTHVLLWAAIMPEKLPPAAKQLLEDPVSRLWFSAASIWEVAIKYGLGRADFDVEPRQLRRGLLDNGWHELAINSEHAVAIQDLPPLHKDPFDRMLLAQAHIEGLTVVTADSLVAQYSGHIHKI